MSASPSPGKTSKPCWGLVHRRPCWVPTLRGWLALALACAVLAVVSAKGVHPFLAVSDPVPGGVLVVEGWAPDYALEEAIAEFKRGQYSKLFVTGSPLERGAPLSAFKTYAELGAATLVRMGLDTNTVQAVPAPSVRQDRTFTSAMALKAWLHEHRIAPTNFNVMSLGAHSRRTRLLFEKALGAEARVGIIAIEDRSYDPNRLWRSSPGVRSVSDEIIAYGYARLVFRPPK
jgi:hypothetical protein